MALSISTGQWGISTIAVNTAGPPVTNSSCLGLNTISTTTAAIQSQEAAAAAVAAKAAKAKSTAIALVKVDSTFLPGSTIGATHWVAYAMTKGEGKRDICKAYVLTVVL